MKHELIYIYNNVRYQMYSKYLIYKFAITDIFVQLKNARFLNFKFWDSKVKKYHTLKHRWCSGILYWWKKMRSNTKYTNMSWATFLHSNLFFLCHKKKKKVNPRIISINVRHRVQRRHLSARCTTCVRFLRVEFSTTRRNDNRNKLNYTSV